MKIVIAGGGRVGAALAARLVGARHSVTVIERDRALCEQLFEDVGAVTVHGDATDARALEAAGIASADIAAAMLPRDADNLAFAMLARADSSARLMVRMLDNRYRDAYRLAGVHDVIAEAEVIVGHITTAIEYPDAGGAIPLAAGDAILIELPIRAHTLAAGRTVAQVRADESFPRDCVFIGFVDPDGHTELPTGSTTLRPGHTAILVARREQLADVIRHLTAEPEAPSETVEGLVLALRRIDFLAPLTDAELGDLARGIELMRRGPGELIFKKGEPGDRFYLVMLGEVVLLDEAGSAVETVRPGGFFGEIALLTGAPRSTTARAEVETELVCIGRDDFRRVVMANPAVALEMSRVLGQRLADAAKSQSGSRWRGLFRR